MLKYQELLGYIFTILSINQVVTTTSAGSKATVSEGIRQASALLH